MSRLKIIYFTFFLTAIIALPFSHFLSYPARPNTLALKTQTLEVPNIIARVGEYLIGRLTGWTSPFAEVNLSGQGIARKTIADNRGYFEFNFAPLKKTFGELCLFSVDVNQVTSRPVCLAPPPLSENIEILDVLLSPSISTNGNNFLKSETAKASGMTFPKSEVDIHIFVGALRATPANPPPYRVFSNENGYFEFSLPTAKTSENRLYAVSYLSPSGNLSILSDSGSPKSNTLSFSVYKIPYWLLLLLILLCLLLLLKRKKSRALIVPKNDIVKSPIYCDTNLSILNPLNNLNNLRNLRV